MEDGNGVSQPYNLGFRPPGPILYLSISRIDDPGNFVVFPALVDSGSDVTIIPRSVADQLELQPISTKQINGIGDFSTQSTVYSARVRIDGLFDEIMKIAALGDEEVIGRDVLRSLTITLDGPGSVLSARSG